MTYSRRTVALALLALSCGDDGGGDGGPDAATDDFDRRALLANLAENIIVPTLEQFAAESRDLASSIDAHCAAIGTGDAAGALEAAQNNWRRAIALWQHAEVMQVGPASPEGDALRDEIYSWPIVNPCAVDQDVMLLRTDPSGYDIASRLPNRRGLDALEYALFAPSLDTLCPPQSAPAGWDELPETDKRTARCAFASEAAADLTVRADGLVAAWSPSGGNFVGELVDAADAHAAVDSVFGALFYLDTKTKDDKLASPAGLQDNSCNATDAPCADELESKFALHSQQNAAANIGGFRLLFRGELAIDGVDGIGFDDFLRAVDADVLADDTIAAIAAALDAIDAVSAPMSDALDSDYAGVVAAHDRVKEVTDKLKGDIPATLGLTIPTEAGGDAD